MNLNLYPLVFDFEEFDITKTKYTDSKLIELREKHNATHSFFRHEDDIYISNKVSNDDLMLGESERITIRENPKIVSSLIKHLFFRTFKERFPEYTPIDFYPFRFYSKNKRDDVIYSVIPDDLKNKIAYKKLIEVQLREIIDHEKKRFVFVINIRRNWIFNVSCLEMNSIGFDIKGMEVLRAEIYEGMSNVLAPNEEFVGIVKKVHLNSAIVETNDGEMEINLKQLFPKKSQTNIWNYLEFYSGKETANSVLETAKSRQSDYLKPDQLHREIQSIASILFYEIKSKKQPILFQNKDGFCFKVDSNMLKVNNSMNLKPPTFIFDQAVTQTDQYSDRGLTNYGPYDSVFFNPKSPQILCISHKNERGVFSSFLGSLFDGLPNSKYFKVGLLKKYDLHKINYEIKEVIDYDFNDYSALLSIESEIKPDFAIIEIPSSFKKLKDHDNPYYQIKAKLLALEIPVQFITTEKVRLNNEFILNSIALQIYAKMGGTPWVLPSARSVDRELVIGIGHSVIRKNQFVGANQDRIVGITTIMSSDGQYLLGDKIKDVSFENYFDALLENLKNILNRLKSEQAWNDKDTIRLIFHIFKPVKNIEFEVVKELIRSYDSYSIQFAFVTISKRHPFKLFDPTEKGVPNYKNRNIMKGIFIPKRASNIFIDDYSCLVQMYGAKELKMVNHGMSTPLLIKIRTPSDFIGYEEFNHLLFTDLNYVVQQVFSFTHLSWRSFLPSEKPASMYYSDLIANILGKLRNIQGWDADVLNYKMKRKKWFL